MSYVIGVDLGQAADYTAFAVLEEKARRYYQLRHLERFRHTAYPAIVERLSILCRLLPEKPSLAVDATGVGRPVIDMIRDAHLPATLYPITITAGDTATQEGFSWRVPKRDLVSAVAVLLQTERLKIAPALKHADTLRRELGSFRVKISLAGNDTYAAWREAEHDDLVLAVATAAWLFEKGRCGWLLYMEDYLKRREAEG